MKLATAREEEALGPEGFRFETRFHQKPAVYGASCTLNHTPRSNALQRKIGEGERVCRLRRRPRYLTAVQNYFVRPKIALVLLQNWMLT
ncbi:hypothetical protein AVEN_178940-1 [Araneus ventricosus]|uniref:Uncharacterized protein n=1 Tax=Araneus ventricosus TaxID=182803 RepID=A0A4Y2TUL1_ARAVE|nr:hypothetical protein AVEN_192891-1 [Araneus ventricosus]GBO04305.1 hypothetical protein AVEN_178940-1 [Araneus ventricosus]